MEQVLGSSTKVIVDTKGTGNMIYLPLDKLLEQRGQQRQSVEMPPTIGLEDGSSVEAPDPRARKDR
jgi:membrane protease subunit HflK